MTRANPTTSRIPDDELLALIARHDQVWAEWDGLSEREGDPRIDQLMYACDELERRIICLPAHTAKGLSGKRRVIRRAEFDDHDGIMESILRFDAERVATGRRVKARRTQQASAIA